MGERLNYIPRGWTEEEMLVVRTLAGRGMSASGIAMQLRGRTRNAVLGVMSRSGLTKDGRAKLRLVHSHRAVPLKRALAAAQLSYEASVTAVSLAGPAWSWPANARETARENDRASERNAA